MENRTERTKQVEGFSNLLQSTEDRAPSHGAHLVQLKLWFVWELYPGYNSSTGRAARTLDCCEEFLENEG